MIFKYYPLEPKINHKELQTLMSNHPCTRKVKTYANALSGFQIKNMPNFLTTVGPRKKKDREMKKMAKPQKKKEPAKNTLYTVLKICRFESAPCDIFGLY